jgi:AcrR family transcriptional regulator
MSSRVPRWRRRSADRPAEIIAAALEVFAETGFAAARLEAIAARAGVSKATLYLYFESKEALFRAAARSAAGPILAALEAGTAAPEGALTELVPPLLARAAAALGAGRAAALARMVIAESRNFPDLAEIWRTDVVGPAFGRVAVLLERAQARDEIAAGDPRLMAFSLVGPLIMGALFAEVFGPAADPPDLGALAVEHARFALRALAPTPTKEASDA